MKALYLADSHAHSSISPDSDTPMEEMCLGAIARGCKELTFTEHFECYTKDHVGLRFDSAYLQRYEQELLRCREKFRDRLIVNFGIELGQPMLDDEKTTLVESWKGLDLTIGSIHKINNIDLGKIDYIKENPAQIFEKNLSLLFQLVRDGRYDVLGHVDLIRRYVARQGLSFSLSPWEVQLRDLFRLVARSGHGIEINTSGRRQVLGSFLPDFELLCMYKEEGGEILTIGSDAHVAGDVCADCRQAAQLAKAAGFSYFATFTAHRPVFHKL